MTLTTAEPVLFGLAAATVWGASDFTGGLATRRARPGSVVLWAHGLSLVLLVGFSTLLHAPSLNHAQTVQAVWSGVTGGVGLMFFYQALSSGLMGLSAALAGLITAAMPVALTFLREGLPGGAKLGGFLVAGVAIVMIASGPGAAPSEAAAARPSGRALLFATLAGIGFGSQLLLLHGAVAGADASFGPALRALTFSRMGGTGVALVAVLLGALRPTPTAATQSGDLRRFLMLASTAGVLDTSGNLLYMIASVTGRLDVAAVLSSLYPAATILLAAALLHERTTRLQTAGMGLAMLAVALISA